jgi:hypothetical protein
VHTLREAVMRSIVVLMLWTITFASMAQQAPRTAMTQQRLHEIVAATASEVRVQGNIAAFSVGEVAMLCVSDPNADRMRILTPVKRVEDASAEEILAAMEANFHTALDARYAISQGVIYAAFIHPLSPLTEEEVVSAIRQVVAARKSFGDSYSSGTLLYR